MDLKKVSMIIIIVRIIFGISLMVMMLLGIKMSSIRKNKKDVFYRRCLKLLALLIPTNTVLLAFEVSVDIITKKRELELLSLIIGSICFISIFIIPCICILWVEKRK